MSVKASSKRGRPESTRELVRVGLTMSSECLALLRLWGMGSASNGVRFAVMQAQQRIKDEKAHGRSVEWWVI